MRNTLVNIFEPDEVIFKLGAIFTALLYTWDMIVFIRSIPGAVQYNSALYDNFGGLLVEWENLFFDFHFEQFFYLCFGMLFLWGCMSLLSFFPVYLIRGWLKINQF